MGCPDWPKCFGKVVPPTSEIQLPNNYKEQFLKKRLQKIEKFTRLLQTLGLNDLAKKVRNDPKLKIAHPYNRATAYTEWVNRLFGVLTGIFALLCLSSAFQFKDKDKWRFRWTLSGVFWVVFNGWLGSVVVETNLIPGIVTVHYVAAYLAFFSFIAALSPNKSYMVRSRTYYALLLAFCVLLVEILAGTRSREIIDSMKSASGFVLNFDSFWNVGMIFDFHRISGILILLLNFYVYHSLRHQEPKSHLFKFQKWVLLLLVLQLLSGAFNTFFDVPALVNVIHISAGAAIAGIQFRAIRNYELNH